MWNKKNKPSRCWIRPRSDPFPRKKNFTEASQALFLLSSGNLEQQSQIVYKGAWEQQARQLLILTAKLLSIALKFVRQSHGPCLLRFVSSLQVSKVHRLLLLFQQLGWLKTRVANFASLSHISNKRSFIPTTLLWPNPYPVTRMNI